MNLRAGLAIVALILTTAAQNLSSQSAPATVPGERNYTLEATMLGFRGVGGAIDGIRNPTLTALTGETVRITIVNGELMVHDIAVEKLNVKSAQILDKGVSTSITFVAKANDTYFCSVPGHRAAGMEGRIDVSDAPRVPPEGELPVANGKPLDLGFESGTLENWTVEGDAFAVVERPGGFRNRSIGQRAGRVVFGQQHGGRELASGHAVVHAVPRQRALRELPDRGRCLRKHPGGAGHRRRQQSDLHDLRRQPRHAPAGGRRSVWLRRTRHLRARGGRRDGGADRRVSQGEPVGPHQLRQLPVPRVEAVLSERDHPDRDGDPAADGSGAARRPLSQKRPQPR